jgi:hypothetical protein
MPAGNGMRNEGSDEGVTKRTVVGSARRTKHTARRNIQHGDSLSRCGRVVTADPPLTEMAAAGVKGRQGANLKPR